MKTFKSVIYGLSILWLAFISINYAVTLVYSGIEDMTNYSLDGFTLFVTMLSVVITIIRYPVKQLVTKWIKEIDKKCKKQKAHGIKANNWKQKTA